jgi:lipoprotein NlpI
MMRFAVVVGGALAMIVQMAFAEDGAALRADLEAALSNGGVVALEAEAAKVLPKAKETNVVALRAFLARAYEDGASWKSAFRQYDWLVINDPAPAWHQRRGAVRFRLGQVKESIADFDVYLKAYPDQMPRHWQRGISYYYAEEYEKGRKQFEFHETVNPRDVENAVFHFMCVAGESGVEKARELLMKTRGDPRVPMKEVYALYAGTGDAEAVLKAVKVERETGDDGVRAQFYADLYIGIHHDLHGRREAALKHMRAAAEGPKRNSYMGSVAQVHLAILEKQLEKATEGKAK